MKKNFPYIILFISLFIYSISSESDINNTTTNSTNTSSDIYYNHTSEEKNLYFVATTFRHGARFPFIHVDFFGNGIRYKGKLTGYGGLQHYEIGKKYRERYSNFLDMNFNPKEMYIRSSDVERTVISTMKELEGLFQKSIGKNFFRIVNYGISYWNLYTINGTARQELERYFGYCDQKNKNKRRLPDISEIFPLLQQCYGTRKPPDAGGFCDSVFTAYFEYTYANQTDNKIGKCGKESADKMYNFCVNYFDTFRGWDERAAYMFYTMYQQIFKYMHDAIEGTSPLKMLMMGGHDVTVDKFMNFLDGLNIIKRTHYPHYACNIVIELRKYSDEFYLEFYYNDILKYNETFQTFMDTLDNSKYSNMYNHCGYPPWIMPEINTTTLDTTIVEEMPTTQTVKETTNKIILSTTQIVAETTQKQEIPASTQVKEVEITTQKQIEITTQKQIEITTQKQIEITAQKQIELTTQKEVTQTTNAIEENIKQTEKISQTQKNEVTTKINEISITQIPKKETQKIEIINPETTTKIKEEKETDKVEETKIDLVQNKTNVTALVQNQDLSPKNSTLKSKLKKFFKQETDLNLYIILVSIIISIFFVIFFVLLFIYLSKKKRKFIRLTEEKNQKLDNMNNNLSVISVENRKEEKK